LTEKVSRRGFHLSREYAVDPLEILFVREVMRSNIVALPGGMTPGALARAPRADNDHKRQSLYPVVDENRRLLGVITRDNFHRMQSDGAQGEVSLSELAQRNPVVAYDDEPLRVVVNRMAETGLTRFPVVEQGDTHKLVGMVSLSDLLRARTRSLEEER